MERRPESEEAARPSWGRLDSIALACVTILAGALRIIRLDLPKELVFDEVYYAKDACFYVTSSERICDTATEITGVHPPLGKWLLAIGVRLFGYDSFGWRIAAAVVGTLTVILLYLLARKLLRSTLAATLASGLLAIDLLHFVQSRVAMLDVFVSFFGVAAFLCLGYDRDRLLKTPPDKRATGLFDRPWRLLAGIAAGCAAASKWSGLVVLAAVVVITIAWEVSARRADGGPSPFTRFLREEWASIVLWLFVVPVAVYMATYLGRIQDVTLVGMPWSEGTWLNEFWDKQVGMLDFHRNLVSTHSYQSPPWSWLLLKRPVSYYFETSPNGDYNEILAMGSPFVWWSSLLALVYVAVRWFKRRALGGAEGLILAGFVFCYVPWLLLGLLSERSAVFIFYVLPAVPFMCLAIAYVAANIGNTWEAKAAIALFVAGAVALFVFYYPLAGGTGLSFDAWKKRLWVFGRDDWCEKPPGETVTSTITETPSESDGPTILRTTTETDDASLPPKGWCWI